MPRNGNIRFLTSEQERKLFDVVDDKRQLFKPWFPGVLATLRATGCRPSEIVGRNARQKRAQEEGFADQSPIQEHHGLRARDVYPDNLLYVAGKNTQGGRRRATSLKPRNVLCADDATYRRLVELADSAEDAEAHVFGLGPSRDTPWYDGYWELVKQIRKLRKFLPSNIREFSPYWLRHTWAITALRSGIDLVSIQRQLGHSRLEETATYLRFMPTDSARIIRAFTKGQHAHVEERDCPACGFAWHVDTRTGKMTTESQMGVVLSRR